MQFRKKLLILAGMINADEDALICDFAETYHVFDYRSLSCKTAAALASGLRLDSRIKMKLSGRSYSNQELLLATIADRLGLLLWAQSEDGVKNVNRPKSIFDTLMGVEDEEKVMSFDTLDEFKRRYEELTR